MTIGGFSAKRLTRVRELLERHVDSGFVPGALAVLARHGAVHVAAAGRLAFAGAGSNTEMATDTICRLGSMSKPIVAACALTLIEDGTLRLDDLVDELLPELAEMRVLADPDGPLAETVAAKRSIMVRDLLTYTLGIGMVPAEPGTVPIADALDAVGEPAPDKWIRRLGQLPLVHQPGERWMYDTAADVTGVLIARATGKSLSAALRERICAPLGMKDTDFWVPGENLNRLATAYERDNASTVTPNWRCAGCPGRVTQNTSTVGCAETDWSASCRSRLNPTARSILVVAGRLWSSLKASTTDTSHLDRWGLEPRWAERCTTRIARRSSPGCRCPDTRPVRSENDDQTSAAR